MVTGQKVWNTGPTMPTSACSSPAPTATCPSTTAITYFVPPMRQPGVEVRPLRQMNGYASFNEVFLSRPPCPDGRVAGEVAKGGTAALTTLAHERRLRGPAGPPPPPVRSETAGP